MNTEQMRTELSKLYSGHPTWTKKLKAMPEGQVIAIYRRLQNEGHIS